MTGLLNKICANVNFKNTLLTNLSLALAFLFALQIILASCEGLVEGLFQAPYDTKMSPPSDEKFPQDIFPGNVNNIKLNKSHNTSLFGTVSGEQMRGKYTNGAELAIIKLEDPEQAKNKLDSIYEELTGHKQKLSITNYSWIKAADKRFFYFGWTNHSWLFLVKAKDEQTAEKVILATGYAKKMIKNN